MQKEFIVLSTDNIIWNMQSIEHSPHLLISGVGFDKPSLWFWCSWSLRTTGWAPVFKPSSSLESPEELLKLLPIGLCFCCCASTTLFWWLSLCGIVWSQGGWFFQLHFSFSRLLWLFGVFSVSLRNLYAGQEATELDIEQQTGSKLGKEYLKYIVTLLI